MEKLEATGAFDSVLPAQRDTTDEGLDRLLVEAIYTGVLPEEPGTPVPAETSPAPAAKPPVAKPATPATPPGTATPTGRAARGGAGR